MHSERQRSFWVETPLRSAFARIGLNNPQDAEYLPRNWWMGKAQRFLDFLESAQEEAPQEDQRAIFQRLQRKFSSVLRRNHCRHKPEQIEVLILFLEDVPGRICNLVINSSQFVQEEIIGLWPGQNSQGLFGLLQFHPEVVRVRKHHRYLGILCGHPITAILLNSLWKKVTATICPAVYIPQNRQYRPHPISSLPFREVLGEPHENSTILVYLGTKKLQRPEDIENLLYLYENRIPIVKIGSSTGYETILEHETAERTPSTGLLRNCWAIAEDSNNHLRPNFLQRIAQSMVDHWIPASSLLQRLVQSKLVGFDAIYTYANRYELSPTILYSLLEATKNRDESDKPLKIARSPALEDSIISQTRTIRLAGKEYLIHYALPQVSRRNKDGSITVLTNFVWEATTRLTLDIPRRKPESILELSLVVPAAVQATAELSNSLKEKCSVRSFVSETLLWTEGVSPVLEEASRQGLCPHLDLHPSLSARDAYYLALLASRKPIREVRRSAIFGYDPCTETFSSQNFTIGSGGSISPCNPFSRLLAPGTVPTDQLPIPDRYDLSSRLRLSLLFQKRGFSWEKLRTSSWEFRLLLSLMYSLICGILYRRYHAVAISTPHMEQDLVPIATVFGWRSVSYANLKIISKKPDFAPPEFWLDKRGLFCPLAETESRYGRIETIGQVLEELLLHHPIVLHIPRSHFPYWVKHRRFLIVDTVSFRPDLEVHDRTPTGRAQFRQRSKYHQVRELDAESDNRLRPQDLAYLWMLCLWEFSKDRWSLVRAPLDDLTFYRKGREISLFSTADEIWIYLASLLERIRTNYLALSESESGAELNHVQPDSYQDSLSENGEVTTRSVPPETKDPSPPT